MATNSGPQRGTAQEIGQDAERALNAHSPERWSLGGVGGRDYGVDYELTVFGANGAELVCNLQLKGTTQENARLKDGVHLSYGFDCATLRLWHNSVTPILIAVADMVDSRDPLHATVHYHFVSPELDDVLSGAQDQAKVNIRIARTNLVHRHLDVLPLIRPYVAELWDARRILRERRLASGNSTDSSALLAISSAGQGTSNFDSPEAGAAVDELIKGADGSEALRASLTALRNGDAARVFSLTREPTSEEAAAPTISISLNAYLRAKAFEFVGSSDSDVLRLLRVAEIALPDNDDVVSSIAQRRLDDIDLGQPGTAERTALLQTLAAHKGPSVATVVAKIHALNQEFAAARRALESVPRPKANIIELIVSIVEGDWSRVIVEAEDARNFGISTPVQSFLIDVLEARAHFQLAMGPMEWPESGDLIIPAAGVAGMKTDALRMAYGVSLAAMYKAQVLRWPAATAHLLDVFPISAQLLGRSEEALPLLASLGRARATDMSVRENVIKFALNADQPSLALQLSELAGSAPRFPAEEGLLATASCRVGDVARAFSLIEDTGSSMWPKDVYWATLMTVGVAADAAMRSEILEGIRLRLDESKEGQHYLAILDSAVSVRSSLLQRGAAVVRLHAYWVQHSFPPVISRHLLVNADPESKSEAAIIREVANQLQKEYSLDADQWASLGQALITLGAYAEAKSQLGEACDRFDLDHRLESLLAISYELNGDAFQAFEMFERLIESGEASESARRYFINSAARIGFLDKAIDQVRGALSKSTHRQARLRHLNTLFQLTLHSSANPVELWELAWQYGDLTDQTNEREEGVFLQEVIAACNSFEPEPGGPRLLEYARRRDRFVEAFPHSKYLRRVDLESRNGGGNLATSLREALGISIDDVRRANILERNLDSGTIVAPFSWRPRRFLTEVSDVLALWQLRRSKSVSRKSWHFNSVADDINRSVPISPAGWEPVVSLTSLLVLNECNLLQVFLNNFHRVVIARATLVALQDARNPITAGLGREIATRILDTLRANFEKITHPPFPIQESKEIGPNWHREELLAMEVQGRFYFCDDVLESAFVCGIEHGANGGGTLRKASACTADLLSWLDRHDMMSPREVAEYIGRLVTLSIGVPVTHRVLVAAIPDSLQCAKTAKDAGTALLEAPTLGPILDGIWAPDRSLDALLRMLSDLLSYLVENGGSDFVVGALWTRWLQTVRLQTEPAIAPLNKLAASLVVVAHRVDDSDAVHRLWRGYWYAVEHGLSIDATLEPDRAGVEAVAHLLGSASVERGHEIAEVSQHVRHALGAGTELDALYERTYINAAVVAAKNPSTRFLPLLASITSTSS